MLGILRNCQRASLRAHHDWYQCQLVNCAATFLAFTFSAISTFGFFLFPRDSFLYYPSALSCQLRCLGWIFQRWRFQKPCKDWGWVIRNVLFAGTTVQVLDHFRRSFTEGIGITGKVDKGKGISCPGKLFCAPRCKCSLLIHSFFCLLDSLPRLLLVSREKWSDISTSSSHMWTSNFKSCFSIFTLSKKIQSAITIHVYFRKNTFWENVKF